MKEKAAASRRVTMRDIARQTGYTVNTVSHALKNMPDISAETRQKIHTAAREMGYVRNTMASALRSGRSHTIAVVIGDIGNPKFATMVNDIESAARAYHYSVIILCTHDDPETEKKAIQTALERQVDGIIINPTQRTDDCIGQLRAAHIPFVLIERKFANHPVDSVVCDEEMGGYLAGKHLLDQGHTRVMHFAGLEHVSSAVGRRQGFLRATADLPRSHVQVVPMTNAAENIHVLRKLQRKGFTGAFFFLDLGVWDVMARLQAEDPQLLRDMAFVGYDNIQGRFSFPAPICSVDPSSTAVCQATVELLHRRIKGEDFPVQQMVFPVQLVCRHSCRSGGGEG